MAIAYCTFVNIETKQLMQHMQVYHLYDGDCFQLVTVALTAPK